MLIIYAVLLGVAYRGEKEEREMVRTYNFIVHSALAGTCLVRARWQVNSSQLRHHLLNINMLVARTPETRRF